MLFGRFDNTTPAQEWAAVAIVGAFFCLASWRSIRDRLAGRSATDWPIVEGEVCSTARGRDYAVTVTYGYRLGEYQSGEFIVPFSSMSESKKFEDRLKTHAKIILRYDPADPSHSALLLSDNEPPQEDL